jgi:hypothetical protein
MTVIDVPANFYFLFLGSGSLDPAYVRGVKRVGDHEKQ